jgi:hypothetical protein
MMATTRITVPLSSAELHALIDAAQRDYRHPRDQARAMLRDALGLAVATTDTHADWQKHNCAVSPFQSSDGAIVATQ